MNKVIGSELKKMVSRPGIYILAFLLALLLTVTAFVYEPKENKKAYNTLSGTTLTEINNDFITNYKSTYDDIVDNTLLNANNANLKTATEYEYEIDTLIQEFILDGDTFCDTVNNLTATEEQKTTSLEAIHSSDNTGSLDRLFTLIITYLGNTDNEIYKIAITKDNFTDLNAAFTDVRNDLGLVNSSKNFIEGANNFIHAYKDKILKAVKTLEYPNYANVLEKFLIDGNYHNVTLERQNVIISKMNAILELKNLDNTRDGDKKLIKQYNDLFNEYRLVCQNYANLFKATTNVCVLEAFSTNEQPNIKFLGKIDLYSQKELKVRYTYYIENDKNEYNFANALSFENASNEKTNAYDFTYFALSIFGVLLIAFAIMQISHSIAGEAKEGTLRFQSIRPVSRTSLIFGKYFSVAIMSFILLVFSALASMIVGGYLFGLNSQNILTIIDASKVVILHPSLSVVIFVASMYLQILVYASIAMLFTSFLKSDLLAFVLTILLYVVNMMLPLFFGVFSWLRFYPFANTNMYSFVGAGTFESNTILGKLFSSVVYSGMTIWLSGIIIMAIIGICNMIATYAFKRREL